MFKQLVVIVFLMGSLHVSAHEGHSTPGALKANHGGVVKAGKEINLEYVVAGNSVKVYPVSHDGKDLGPADVKLTATSKIPKGKTEAAKLVFQEGSFVSPIDFKGAYRVEMNVTADINGKKDTFKFQVEK